MIRKVMHEAKRYSIYAPKARKMAPYIRLSKEALSDLPALIEDFISDLKKAIENE
jgi:hypothetical protein